MEKLQISLTVKYSENVVKSGCFEKSLRWRAPKEWFLFEILHDSSTLKTSKKMEKVDVSKKFCHGERKF